MRVLVLALCLAAGGVLVPAGALAAGPGSVHQSNRQTQVTVVDNRGSQSAGLINVSQNTIPIQVGLGANLNDVLNHINIL